MTPAVTIIDPARRTAVLCNKTLKDNSISNSDHSNVGSRKFYVTGPTDEFLNTTALLLGDLVTTAKTVVVK